LCQEWLLIQKEDGTSNYLTDQHLELLANARIPFMTELQDRIWTVVSEWGANVAVTTSSSNTCTAVRFWTVRQVVDALGR
jgi:hypothetical protein